VFYDPDEGSILPGNKTSECSLMNLTSRRFLQLFAGVNVLIACYNGGAFVLLGIDAVPLIARAELGSGVGDPARALLDTWYRVLGWNWVCVGLMLAWVIPAIERHTAWFRFIMVAFMAVGVGRISAVAAFGFSDHNPAYAIAIELLVPTVCIVWQSRVSAQAPDLKA
jgi:hypothetical protein